MISALEDTKGAVNQSGEGHGARRHPIQVRLTAGAERALAVHPTPLLVELELLFSCLIRKRVRFPAAPHADAIPVPGTDPRLTLYFHPVCTKVCAIGDAEVPDLLTFPIRRVTPFIPRAVTLDYRKSGWTGDFSYPQERR
ncbi:hypothetical protein HF285_05730 [Acidithiobacillus ferrooxidans F221]|uniref:hypothetical protein n=1 Tax=Acidithiobacillus ferrooxidans TaxID=920 RepID=UPI001C067CA8|nr:hypothetical protein [Acidithiobacillus ferrooxidans]MBU2807780.1 hypothetical protein [Acidithiobacillus ferrooxidans F221]